MTDQVANTEGASATAHAGAALESASSGPEIIRLPPGQPPQKRKKKRKNQQRQTDRRPAMSFKDLEGTERVPKPRKAPAEQGRKRPDGTPSRREASRKAMLEWQPNASHPADLMTVQLRTEYTKKLFLDHYGRAQISLYNLICLLRIKMRENGLDKDMVNDFGDLLEGRIDTQLEGLKKRLEDDIKKAKRMLSINAASEVKRYSGDGDLDATLPVLTPHISQLLDLLPIFDEFIGCVDGLWINRFLRTRQREETINNYRNEIAQLIRHYMHMYHESKRLLGEGKHNDLSTIFKGERDELSPEDESLAASILQVTEVSKPAEATAVAAA